MPLKAFLAAAAALAMAIGFAAPNPLETAKADTGVPELVPGRS